VVPTDPGSGAGTTQPEYRARSKVPIIIVIIQKCIIRLSLVHRVTCMSRLKQCYLPNVTAPPATCCTQAPAGRRPTAVRDRSSVRELAGGERPAAVVERVGRMPRPLLTERTACASR